MHISIDRFIILLEFEATRPAVGEIVRHISPRTCDAVLAALPVRAKAYLWQKQFLYFETPVSHGPERPQKAFEAGDIAFWPLESAICVHLGPGPVHSPMNRIGRVLTGFESLSTAKHGSILTFRLKPPEP